MQDAKTGGSRWVPDIREDEITEFQEQNGDETATYKAVNVHPIISRVLDKLAFFRTHVSAVWYNKLANKTVKDKLDEIDTSINSLNSRAIKTGYTSGTTSPTGNLQTSLLKSDLTVLAAFAQNENRMVSVYPSSTDYWYFRVEDYNGDIVASQEISFVYYYVDS